MGGSGWVGYLSFWGEWPSGFRHCIAIRIRRFPVQTPEGAWPGLGTQPCYEAPVRPGRNCITQ